MSRETDKPYCCDVFRVHASELMPTSRSFAYPPHVAPPAQFVRAVDQTWHIHGCCGGGCYVVTGMRYCPFCGSGIA